jgi:hypothetical protein
MTWLIITEHMCHKRPRICSTCRKHKRPRICSTCRKHKRPGICSTCRKYFPVLSSFMTYPHIVARIIRQVPLVDQELLPFRSTCVHSHVLVRVTRSLVLCIMFCRSLFVLLSCFFWPLCCLSFDLLIGIFKLFF